MNEVLEVTVLGPARGLTPEDFACANDDIDAYLQRQPGFRWRRILAREDGSVVDIVAYDNLMHARSEAAGITGEMSESPVHATIDHSTVDWQFARTLRYVEPAPAPDVRGL